MKTKLLLFLSMLLWITQQAQTARISSRLTNKVSGSNNTISGEVRLDANNNGCDGQDQLLQNFKLKIDDGTTTGTTTVGSDGKYNFSTQAGNFTVTPQLENPNLFTITPSQFSTSFSDTNNNAVTQNFCVTANGVKDDAEVVIMPITNAIPGNEVKYNLVWRNKGNTTLSGRVIFNFDSNKLNFVNSSVPYTTISAGSIEFAYSNLFPLQSASSEIAFNVKPSTDATNPAKVGDVLSFNAQVSPSLTDIFPQDNFFYYDQTVVSTGSSNSIVCLEGGKIPTSYAGKSLHYAINFENTGTTDIQNVTVAVNINPTLLDISTLQVQAGSDNIITRVNGNIAEFICQRKSGAGGHGSVLMKISTKPDLVQGDIISTDADIYFDNNPPVKTNTYNTIVYNAQSALNAKISYSAGTFSAGNYPVNFDASQSTGNIISYQWEFSGTPNVSSTTVATPLVTYTTAGMYNAKLTVSDGTATSSQTVTFTVGSTVADLSTGRDNSGNIMAIDSDEDDWKGYDINGALITPKVRHTYTGWSYADLGTTKNSQWITLNNLEGNYIYKSREFIIPDNSTDAKLNLRSLSFVRNWTYLVKINTDGSETEAQITQTDWLGDGVKGWLNTRSPLVSSYPLSPGRYYIKVAVYSNNGDVRESLDVNANVTSSIGLINTNKSGSVLENLETQNLLKKQSISVYPIPTKDNVYVSSTDIINYIEVYDGQGKLINKSNYGKSNAVVALSGYLKGAYHLRIVTAKDVISKTIIKD